MVSPLFFSAIAGAIGFYFLSSVHAAIVVVVLLLSLFVLCFFRVLASFAMFTKEAHSQIFHVMAFCSAAFAVGLVFGLCASEAGRNEVKFGIPHEKVTGIEGTLLEDPRVLSSGSVMVSVSLRRSSIAGENVRVSSSGEITMFFPQENVQRLKSFGRGTGIFAEGVLRSAEQGWTFSASSLHITKSASAIERLRTNIRLNLLERFDGKSWGGLALALLVGVRDNLDSSLTSLYRDAGLSYILALSGMHLAIIAAVIAFLLKKPLGLKAASIVGAVIISLYCLFVGPFPSLIRSTFMYLLSVLTLLGALPRKSISILSLSFLIQLIVTPAAGNSLSFILSYMALFGILITSRHLSFLFKGFVPDFLLQPLSLSGGAFLATAGIVSFSFGKIAPIGIIAGLLIIPLTTVFMVVSMIWLVLDLFSVSFILNLPLSWIYRLMEITTYIAGNIPGITANPSFVLGFSILLLVLIAALNNKRRTGLLKLKQFL
ncbi:MAG: ComEC/Rec2 family competence protein [Treponema sp.]|jgi:competence protein ComEC|nr:ComEC/Rec2 family competence protein [Treponema sp.]